MEKYRRERNRIEVVLEAKGLSGRGMENEDLG